MYTHTHVHACTQYMLLYLLVPSIEHMSLIAYIQTCVATGLPVPDQSVFRYRAAGVAGGVSAAAITSTLVYLGAPPPPLRAKVNVLNSLAT